MTDTEAELQPMTETTPEAAGTSSPPLPAVGPAASGFPWETPPLAQFPMAELVAEIERRRKSAGALLAERARIEAQLEHLEAELRAMRIELPGRTSPRSAAGGRRGAAEPGAPRAPRAPRARNEISLADALASAVEVRATISPAEATRLVLANGYRSGSKTFNIAVASTLAKDPRFRRVGRGQYERID